MAKKRSARRRRSTIGRRSTHTQMLGVTRKMPMPSNMGMSPGGSGTMTLYPTFGGPLA